MRRIVIAAVGMLALAGPVLQLKAQLPPPMAATIVTRSPEQLDQLLGPIALYPDPLIAQILPAATLTSQIVMADRYVQQGMGLDVIDQQPWDPSVKALARYPDLLRWMDTNLAWTTDVGQTYIYQQVDVMNAIQRLRYQAMNLGNLQSTPQQTVYNNNGVIEIVPANPQVIYVPVYQPQVVYAQRAPRPGVFVSFGLGVAIGGWLNHDVDWHDHRVVEWRRNNPRPNNYWYHRQNDRNHVTVVNNTTVINNRVDRNRPNWPTHREPAPAPVIHNRVETRDVRTPQPPPYSRPTYQPQQQPHWSGDRDGHGRP